MARLGLLPSVHELAARLPDAVPVSAASSAVDFLLDRQGGALTLTQPAAPAFHFHLDFLAGTLGYRLAQGRARQETLVRAVRGRHALQETRVLDATAGLGRDAALLAAAGLQVMALERDPLLHLLLADALERAAGLAWTAQLMLVRADALRFLEELPTEQTFDVIYLDPMFAAGDSRAQVKKELAWLKQWLASPAAPEDAALLRLARQRAGRRVVVKRAAKAPPLAGENPTASVDGKAVRFDIYTPL